MKSKALFRKIKPTLLKKLPMLYYRVWKKPLKYSPPYVMLMGALSAKAAKIDNPISSDSFLELIRSITNALIPIAAVFAVVAIIFAGFKFIMASATGDSKKLGEAKSMFFWILIGTAIVVGARVLAEVAVNFAKGLQ